MAVFPYDIEHYMQCPGPIVDGLATGQCGEIIPKVINCTGANHGKRCQRVRTLVLYVLIGVDSIYSAMSARTSFGCLSKTMVPPLQVRNGLETMVFAVNRPSRPCETATMLV
jgi:hypothetical protein